MAERMDFDPNVRANAPEWATYIPHRNGPAFKTHTKRGHALNAFHRPGILYRYDFSNGRWTEIHREESLTHGDPPLQCDMCGITAKEAEDRRETEWHAKRAGRFGRFYRREYDALKMMWVDKKSNTPRRVPVCVKHREFYAR